MNTREIGRELTHEITRDIVLMNASASGGPLPVWSNDFRAQSLGSGMSFVRSSGAGFIDSSGGWSVVGNNVPRYEYDPVGLMPKGLLVEESRTNYFLNSTAPATQAVSLATGTYSLTVAGSGSCACAAGTAVGSEFGVATAASAVVFRVTTAGTVVFTVSGVLTRFQCERGTLPTSFIDTAGSAATRNGDICGGSLAGVMNPVEGTFFLHAAIGHNIATALSVDDGSGGDSTRMYVILSATARTYFMNIAGVTVLNENQSGSLPVGSLIKLAMTYGPSGGKLVIGGSLVSNNSTPCNGLEVNTLRIGLRYQPTAGRNLNGSVAQVSYYDKALSTEQLQQMTV